VTKTAYLLNPDPSDDYYRRIREATSDEERRKIHAESVTRADILRSGRSAAQTIVSQFQAAVASVVSAARLGEEGLVTKKMINDLRRALDLLEGEL
jgi:uracil phosphoribosyltransferase